MTQLELDNAAITQAPDPQDMKTDGISMYAVRDLGGDDEPVKVTNTQMLALLDPGYIRGALMSWVSTSAIAIAAGTVCINGEILPFAGGTVTSGSTMKDVANATVTVGNSKAYHVFLMNDAGTVRHAIEEADGSGDGGVPTLDADLDYYKSASTGASVRRIGKIYTTSGGAIIYFKQYRRGLRGRFTDLSRVAISLVSAGTQGNSYTSVTLTPYVTADDESLFLTLRAGFSTGTNGVCSLTISTDGGTNDDTNIAGMTTTTGNLCGAGKHEIANTGTIHYKGPAANPSNYIDLVGISQIV